MDKELIGFGSSHQESQDGDNKYKKLKKGKQKKPNSVGDLAVSENREYTSESQVAVLKSKHMLVVPLLSKKLNNEVISDIEANLCKDESAKKKRKYSMAMDETEAPNFCVNSKQKNFQNCEEKSTCKEETLVAVGIKKKKKSKQKLLVRDDIEKGESVIDSANIEVNKKKMRKLDNIAEAISNEIVEEAVSIPESLKKKKKRKIDGNICNEDKGVNVEDVSVENQSHQKEKKKKKTRKSLFTEEIANTVNSLEEVALHCNQKETETEKRSKKRKKSFDEVSGGTKDMNEKNMSNDVLPNFADESHSHLREIKRKKSRRTSFTENTANTVDSIEDVTSSSNQNVQETKIKNKKRKQHFDEVNSCTKDSEKHTSDDMQNLSIESHSHLKEKKKKKSRSSSSTEKIVNTVDTIEEIASSSNLDVKETNQKIKKRKKSVDERNSITNDISEKNTSDYAAQDLSTESHVCLKEKKKKKSRRSSLTEDIVNSIDGNKEVASSSNLNEKETKKKSKKRKKSFDEANNVAKDIREKNTAAQDLSIESNSHLREKKKKKSKKRLFPEKIINTIDGIEEDKEAEKNSKKRKKSFDEGSSSTNYMKKKSTSDNISKSCKVNKQPLQKNQKQTFSRKKDSWNKRKDRKTVFKERQQHSKKPMRRFVEPFGPDEFGQFQKLCFKFDNDPHVRHYFPKKLLAINGLKHTWNLSDEIDLKIPEIVFKGSSFSSILGYGYEKS